MAVTQVSVEAPGWPARWLNAWLAAVGATVLVPELRLSWTEDADPFAVLHGPADPIAMLAEAWPTPEAIASLPIARHLPGHLEMPRKVTREVFTDRAAYARTRPDHWALSSTVTDLAIDDDGGLAHSPFDPPAPRGETMGDRLQRLADALPDRSALPDLIEASTHGRVERIAANGLGFDVTRLGSLGDDTRPFVDPIVEILAFYGMALFPVRGAGIAGVRRAQPRGWRRSGRQHRFVWPIWHTPLDQYAIDALVLADTAGQGDRLGVSRRWASISYEARGASDVTRGFASEPWTG